MNDFSDLTDSAYEQERKKALAATAPLAVSVASTKSPDAAAKAMSLSRRYNVPPAVAEQFAEDYSARAKQEDAQNVMARAPKLGSWIAEQPERADLVHDDLDNLGGIEQTIGRLASYTMGARPDGGLPVDLTKMARSLAAGFGPRVGAGAYGAAAYPAEALGLDGIGARMRELQRSSQAVADKVAGVDPEAGLIERGIMSGMQSAGQTMATLPLGFMRGAAVTGEALMLGAMGALTFGQTYGKGRDDGLSVGQAGFYGMQDATVEVVTEKFLGAAKLVGDAKAGMGAAKLFVRDIAREIPGEMGATLWQNFNEWANLNPDKTLNEWLSEQPEALAETIIATIVGGGAQVGAIRGVQKIMGDTARRQAQADEAEQHASQAEQLAGLLAASKTAGRDATTLREFIAQVADEEGDAPTQFYVDGEQLLNVLNQSGMSRDEFAALAPTAAAQLDEALTGGMVRLPVGEFAAAGEKITAPLIDHLRASEDAPTRAEAREFMAGEGKALQEEVERELQKRGDDATFRDSVAGIQTRFEAELNAAGRFTPEVNKGYATLLSNFFGATAARLGMAPDELLAKYELRVQAKASDGRRVMNQVETDTPAFRKWFGLSKVVDAAGKPLVVYHGTRGDVTAFAPNKVKGRFPNSEGFYFASRPSHASAYADSIQNAAEDFNPASRFAVPVAEGANVIPAYVSLQNPKVIKVSEWGTLESAVDGDGGARVRAAREAGHDGVIVKREAGDEWDGMLVVAFRPEQIKSATGNRGTFGQPRRSFDGRPDTFTTKNLADGLMADAEFLSELAKTRTFRAFGLGGFDIPTQRAVMSRVVGVLQDKQVRQAVIDGIPVDMVDILRAKQLTAEMLLNDVSMLSNLAAIDGNYAIAFSVDEAAKLADGVARLAAKNVAGLLDRGRSSPNSSAATSAGNGDDRAERRGVTRVGAEDDASLADVASVARDGLRAGVARKSNQGNSGSKTYAVAYSEADGVSTIEVYDPSDPNILNQSAQEDRKAKIIELRKRESILKSLQECMA